MIDIRNMGQTFFVTSLIISAYSIFLALNHFFGIGSDTFFTGILELITLPLLFFQHIIALLSLIFWIRHKCPFPSYLLFALVPSLCNSIAAWL